MDQTDHDRDFNQGTDDGRESSAVMDAEGCDRHGDGQFEVIRCCSKRKSRRLPVGSSHFMTHDKRNQKHHHEINQQRNGNANDIQRELYDVFALSENMTTIVNSKAIKVMGLIRGMKRW